MKKVCTLTYILKYISIYKQYFTKYIMPKEVTKETKQRIRKYIKEKKEVSITKIRDDLNITFSSIKKVLDELQKKGDIIIARIETITDDDKIITQSINIKWKRNRK